MPAEPQRSNANQDMERHAESHRNDGTRDVEYDAAARRPSRRKSSVDVEKDEYLRLVKYVSTYRDPSSRQDEETGEVVEKRLWWAPWRKRKYRVRTLDRSTCPEEWLMTPITNGLSSGEIDSRRKRAGFNELTAEKENLVVKFLSYFRGPILYVMEIAVLHAAGLSDWVDFGVIIGILMLNATVGWYQEKQAADVVASLKADIAMKARVVWDGEERDILARELVPGDVVIISEGKTVPADAKVICEYGNAEKGWREFQRMQEEGELSTSDDSEEDDDNQNGGNQDGPNGINGSGKEKSNDGGDEGDSEDEDESSAKKGYPILACDHSAITGESLAVDRYVGDNVFYTTGCKRGQAYAVVRAIGTKSFVGNTASMVQSAQDTGHFKMVMDSIGTSLLVIVLGCILAAWIGGFYRHIPIASPGEQTLLFYALDLLIIGVPVGLPVVTTTTMAVGAADLAKKKAIVQKLTAIESLSGVDILCSDKTGTLTANKLSIRYPYVAERVDINWMFAVAALASSHNIETLDPIDKVTILTLRQYPKAKEILREGWNTEKFTPFDPVSKRIVSVVTRKDTGERYTCTKGAPKAVLQLTKADKKVADAYKAKFQEFAQRGFRSLGVAVQKEGEDWKLLGILPMFDPPREDTAHTIAEAQKLGISVKMLTGDALAIAKETCKMLALGTKVYNSEKLISGGLSGPMASDLVEKADGFAEVFPEHKFQAVQMLQERGHLTAMTGDGVNDAPSLKRADCGIAVEGASEAAQSAADIVFLEPGLSTIIDSIKVAREIFHRMKAYIQYRIALCLHLEIYLVTTMIVLNESIRTDLVVFLALFADLATVAVAYDNASYETRPVEWQLPKIWIISVILGILLALGAWVIRGTLFLPDGGIIQNWGSIQEVLFLEVALTQNWLIFVTRGGKTWPSLQLVGAILGVDMLATCFALFGWFSGSAMITDPYDQLISTPKSTSNGWTDIVTVVRIWGFSFGVEVVIALVYYVLNKISWLDNLGRSKRSKDDIQIENILGHLARVGVEYEKDGQVVGRLAISSNKTEDEVE